MKSKEILQKKSHIIYISCCILGLLDSLALAAHLPQKPIKPNGQLIEFSLPQADESQKKVEILKFDEKTYELAYTIFLQNNNTRDAFSLAFAAVKQHPDSKKWRKRLAQTAVWNQEPFLASQQYLYLVEHFNDQEAMADGMKLAKSMSDDNAQIQFIAVKIKNDTANEDDWQDYVNALLRLGEPQKAIDLLSNNKARFSNSFYLWNLAKIYRLEADLDAQFKTLSQYQATLGATPEVASQLATIYVTKNELKKAFEAMRSASKKADDTDYHFWSDYAQIALLVNNPSEELKAYQKELNQKKPDEDLYIHLIDLIKKYNPNLAFSYAKEGVQAYPKSFPLNSMLFALASETGQWQNFTTYEQNLPPSVSKLLRYDPSFWELGATYWENSKNHEAAIQSYMNGITYSPNNDAIKSDYLFFLIQSDDLVRIAQSLPLWQYSLSSMPQLWSAYAQAYERLGNRYLSRLIAQQFYDIFEKYQHDPYWLIFFKDVLDSIDLPRESWALSHYAWPLYLDLLNKQGDAVGYNQILNYSKLAIQTAPGDATGLALNMLQQYANADVELLLLTWALEHRNYPLATAIYRYYLQAGITPPSWPILNIALIRYDRHLMRDLLTEKKEIVSYRDRVQAAQNIDAIPLAQKIAYEELARHPQDEDLYDNYFTPVMLKTADHFYISQEFYQYGSAEGPRTITYFTHFITPSISITPYNSLWLSRNLSSAATSGSSSNNSVNQVIASIPPHDERAGIKIDATQNRGTLEVDIGYRHDLNSFSTAKVSRTYKVVHDLDTVVTLGYHQQADDTLALLIGGMKNYIFLRGNYILTSKDTLVTQYSQNFFYTQDEEHVANGGQGTILFEHKFWHRFPDWTLSEYATFAKYYDKTGLLTGSILSLVPANVIPNANFLIPENFREYGITGSFGQHYIDDYTHSWRPFASGTLFHSSSVGPGKVYNLGFAGTVWGRDHLLIYYEYGTSQAQGIKISRLAKVSYEMYF